MLPKHQEIAEKEAEGGKKEEEKEEDKGDKEAQADADVKAGGDNQDFLLKVLSFRHS